MKDRKPISLTLLLAQPQPHTRELPSGRIVPGFGPPGTTLACSRACKAPRCRATLTHTLSLDNYRENQGKSQF